MMVNLTSISKSTQREGLWGVGGCKTRSLMSCQWVLAAQKADCILGCNRKKRGWQASRSREVILYSKACESIMVCAPRNMYKY